MVHLRSITGSTHLVSMSRFPWTVELSSLSLYVCKWQLARQIQCRCAVGFLCSVLNLEILIFTFSPSFLMLSYTGLQFPPISQFISEIVLEVFDWWSNTSKWKIWWRSLHIYKFICIFFCKDSTVDPYSVQDYFCSCGSDKWQSISVNLFLTLFCRLY